ncbi:hypothetical protein QLS71_002600 [Mariniflexile litorale]|uniref:Uncharacterized protein n=1 Tax=Mariniflexile litorale TaxID=3045158 RepID=A0AAU7EIG4_9FLAO|nr:hypothetical protein [Mariniflexile sp. KMM 9835]MDQ8209908.1 hypothetical protein [Mariniflexile sp. KMM 9835]
MANTVSNITILDLTKGHCQQEWKIRLTIKNNEILREPILEIVKNQLENNAPPETKITYNKLTKNGYNDFQSRQMIGQCVAIELFEIIKMGLLSKYSLNTI